MTSFKKGVAAALVVWATGAGSALLLRQPQASAAPEKAAPGREQKADRAAKAKFEVYKDKSGEYRWRLRATNTQILAMAAQGYSDKRSVMSAIESVKRDVPEAPVEEQPDQQPKAK